MVKLAMYRYQYEVYHPKAMIVDEEYSYTSSFLTEYCHRLGVEHIDIMHGEKLYFIRDTFFCFDRCYVWDGYYRDLFCQLRAEPTAELSGHTANQSKIRYIAANNSPGTNKSIFSHRMTAN